MLAVDRIIMEESEQMRVRRMRNMVAYQGIRNSIVEWMNSPAWTTIPGFMNIRGECVTRYISSKSNAKLVKIVSRGTVSGEIQCR